ncbi:MAG: TetR/AcrR family transcriptional regulator [Hyphomicrobium sp.]
MPKLKPDTQRARREHILDAAEQCFAREGFHATTMQDICRQAAVSPGALYVYFTSKEALIEGICERDRSEFQARFADLASADDFFAALRAIGEQYFVEEPAHKRLMCVEIGMESTRNPRVGTIFRSVDDFVHDSFQELFQRLKDEGRIAPSLDIPTLAKAFCLVGDGMFWRRAIDPGFDANSMIPAMVALIKQLLNPVEQGAVSGHHEVAP